MPIKLINAKRQAEKRKPPIFYVFGVTRSGIEPPPPAYRADALTTAVTTGEKFNLFSKKCIPVIQQLPVHE